MTDPPTPRPPGRGRRDATDHHARRWVILGALALSRLIVVLDGTIVNISLPSARAALGFDDADRQWVITAYALAFGALLAPASLSLLTVTFTDPEERGRASGIFGAVAVAAVGLLLGGALTEWLDWIWCLHVNVSLTVVAVVATFVLIPRGADASGSRLDVPGTVTAVLGLVSLVHGFSRAGADDRAAPTTLGFIGAVAVLLAVFVAVERRVAHPLLPLRVVLDRWRGGAYLAISLAAIGMFAVFLFLTSCLQRTVEFSPLRTGFAFLPMVVGIMVPSTVLVPRLLPRLGPKALILPGQVAGAGTLAWMSTLQVGDSYATHVMPQLLLMGLGMGLIFGSCFNTATSGPQRRDAGVASAMLNTGQQVGGAISTALLSGLQDARS